jgi:hypothetical protein
MSEGLKDALPWIVGALLVVLVVVAAVLMSMPEHDLLPGIYEYQVL